ncbi:hypothetical protein PINS_up004919 [Pythium insidiosum]|nr:hypothetical protein PINS_up004919 [Pythium insidiosum]
MGAATSSGPPSSCTWRSRRGQSALFNFLPVFYQHTAQFSKLQISVLQAVPCVCSMLAPPLWGAIADQLHRHRAVHVLCIVTGALLLYGVQFCRRFDLTVLLVALGNFQTAPSGSLLDHAVLDLISKIGGEYGKQRLFGAVGYGAGAYVTGLIVAAAGVASAFDVSLVLSLSSLLVLRQIPAMEFYEEERQDPIRGCVDARARRKQPQGDAARAVVYAGRANAVPAA